MIDLRSLPPNMAEVYVLTIMQKLQRRCRPSCSVLLELVSYPRLPLRMRNLRTLGYMTCVTELNSKAGCHHGSVAIRVSRC